jgi:hypothetical protein
MIYALVAGNLSLPIGGPMILTIPFEIMLLVKKLPRTPALLMGGEISMPRPP